MAKPRGNVYQVGASYRVKFPRGRDPVTGKYLAIQETYPTEDAAWARLNKLRVEHAEGTLVPPSKITVAQFAERWLAAKRGDVRGSSVRNYKPRITSITSYMGHVPLAKVDVPLIYAWRAERLKTHHPNTVRQHQTLLNMLFRAAVRWKIIVYNPTLDVALPAYVKPVRSIWNRPQMLQFFTFCETHPDGAMWRLMLTTGIRIGELCALTWDDLFRDKLTVRDTESMDEHNHYLVHAAKSDESVRSIALSQETIAALHDHRQRQRAYREQVGEWWNDGNWMFPSKRGTRRLTNSTRAAFTRVCKQADLPVITPHGLRHTNGTDMMRARISPRVAQQRLGHHDVALTLGLYGHPDDEMDAEAATLLERPDNTSFVTRSLRNHDKSG